MSIDIPKLIAHHKHNESRHGEMLESVAAMHGAGVATALYVLHRSFRISTADVLFVRGHLPPEARKRYDDVHAEAYADLAVVVLTGALGDKWDAEGAGICNLLAQMNADTVDLLLSASSAMD